MGKGRKPATELEDLPEGWVIKERIRESGQIDKFPHDTKTNKTFRSMVEVKKYLGLDGTVVPCPEPLQFIQGSSSSGSEPAAKTGSSSSGSEPAAKTATTTHCDQSYNVKDGMVPQSDSLVSKSTNYQGSGPGTQSENKRKRDDHNVTPIKKKTVEAGDEEENFV